MRELNVQEIEEVNGGAYEYYSKKEVKEETWKAIGQLLYSTLANQPPIGQFGA
jgi:hypothetical protein